MKKVTNNAVNALLAGRNFSEGNTSIIVKEGTAAMYLHGNLIAERIIESGKLLIQNAGWFSNTTKERLNALPGVSISQKAGKWYLNGKQWDGKFVVIG